MLAYLVLLFGLLFILSAVLNVKYFNKNNKLEKIGLFGTIINGALFYVFFVWQLLENYAMELEYIMKARESMM